MGSGLYALLAFVVAIGILVTVHEFGHFWVARRVGVKVLRFSVGFGRPLWRRIGQKDGTEYVIAALPLGGYVKMLGESGDDEVPEADRERSFDSQPLSARAAIVAAGPLFNFIFAIIAFSSIQMVGVSGMKPVVGEVHEGSISALSGMHSGDEIISVGGRPVRIWQQALEGILGSVVLGDEIPLEIVSSSGVAQKLLLQNPFRENIPEGMELLEQLGFTMSRPPIPPRLGELVSGGAAELSGLEDGDLILSVEGEEITSWREWVEWVRESPEQQLSLIIERDGVIFPLQLTPAMVEVELPAGESGKEVIGRIGVAVDLTQYRKEHYREAQYGPLEALVRGTEKSWEMASMTLQVMGRMVVGATSTDGLSGPISIARYAGISMESGVVPFLSFLGLISVSLGVLNLLPVPLLDGGHLFYYLVEWVRGEPLSESAMAFGQRLGIVFLVGLMSLALYNDLLRLM